MSELGGKNEPLENIMEKSQAEPVNIQPLQLAQHQAYAQLLQLISNKRNKLASTGTQAASSVAITRWLF